MRKLALALFLFGTIASAEQTSEQNAEARALFEQARALMKDGDYASAQSKLEESQRLFPGKGILFNLAVCYEHTGKLASAWTRYLEVAAAERRAGDDERATIAQEAGDKVAPRVPKLTLVVAATPNLTVERDGTVVAPARWGSPLPVDPGPHRIVATAPGRVRFEQSIEARELETSSVTIPELAVELAPVVTPIVKPRERPSTLRTVGLVTGGVGIATLLTGAGLGIAALATYSASDCNPADVCMSQHGVDLRNQSLGLGDAATVTLTVGAVIAATGVVVWLLAPSARKTMAAGIVF